MPDIPATPFQAALERAKTQRERAQAIGEQLRAEAAQRVQSTPDTERPA